MYGYGTVKMYFTRVQYDKTVVYCNMIKYTTVNKIIKYIYRNTVRTVRK